MEAPAEPPRGRRAQAWTARSAIAVAVLAVALALASAGLRSLLLLGVGAAGAAVTAAAVWWALTNRGVPRILAAILAVSTPVAVLVYYVTVGLLWVVLLASALWTLALVTGRAALSMDTGPDGPPEYSTPPPRRPFLIMNPVSGGGKVVRFHLADKARRLGADVVVLDPHHPQDVAALARSAADDGANLLGVAAGDGTQALVAAVAARRGLPFLVIAAGTRNHLAMDLGLDRDDPAAGLDALTDGVELHIDLGFAGGRVFVNNASFGAYAAVVQSPAYREDKVHTTLDMLPDLLTRHRGPRLTVHAGDVVIDAPQAVLISNNPYRTGDPAGLAHRDRLDSGVLGVLGIRVASAAQAAGLLRGGRYPGLTALTRREVVVDADAAEIAVGVDGEALTLPAPVTCEISPDALRVRVPRLRPGVPRAKRPMDWRRLHHLAWPRLRSRSPGSRRAPLLRRG
ncbi:diacylglycerol/lipid kinase family protein [Actinomadura roseirufa]|uniref:diacylglycerol/lipid kinase family protein n=1 Tax=Actinomadura roseirufa TaxID=2094049 RepID=UPI00104115CD|nr:diacylglycerol kinase family protein [Actinomadura roseirufa]